VQPEAVAVATRGEAMLKDAREVLDRDPHARVRHFEHQAVRLRPIQAHRDARHLDG
jgi:hypothetical protein